jgi:DNA topoisomerase-2
MSTIDPKVFLDEKYAAYSAYDNIRKIGHLADGLKNASRKILHVAINSNINEFIKVSNLGPRIQDSTQYLHGSLDGTLVNNTADYVGSSNNIPILLGSGNFGTRHIRDSSANRYISAKLNPAMKNIFINSDYSSLIHQSFEGDNIEPKFYMPIIPMLFVNGSDGVSVGFSQLILPRNPTDIANAVLQKIKGKSITDIQPWYKGFNCDITPGVNNKQWIISGKFTRTSAAKITVTELPISYSLKKYEAVLEKLVESGVIKSYDDRSENDTFTFDINVTKEFCAQSDEAIMKKLKLVETVSEIYTAIDENNRVVMFESIDEMLDSWLKLRLMFNTSRKEKLISEITSDIDLMSIKAKFILKVLNGDIVLNNKSKADITAQIIDTMTVSAEPFIDTLLGMPLYSLTKERIATLDKSIIEAQTKLAAISKLTETKMLENDIKQFTK